MKTAATNIVLTAYQQLSPEEKQFIRQELQLVSPNGNNEKKESPDLLMDKEAAFMDLLNNAIYREP